MSEPLQKMSSQEQQNKLLQRQEALFLPEPSELVQLDLGRLKVPLQLPSQILSRGQLLESVLRKSKQALLQLLKLGIIVIMPLNYKLSQGAQYYAMEH